MPNFSFRTGAGPVPALTAGLTIANALAGSPFEFVGRDAKVAVAAALDPLAAPPTIQGEVTTNITFGSELQLQAGVIPLSLGGIGGGARIPDQVLVDDVAEAGDRLVVELVNAGGGTNIVSGIVRILPI